VGLEADHVTWAQQRSMAAEWFPDAELVATEGVVAQLRRVKDDGEVARIADACRIADEALAAVRPRLHDRLTEADFGVELDFAMRRLGAADVSFETIVASGPNGAKPHHRPGSRTIVDGDLVVLDFGALVDGYHSDMTRTYVVGEPTDTQRRMWDVVAESQRAGVAAVHDGVSGKEVDRVCRSVIADAGWGDAFLHGTGHGVGLLIHEDPRVSSASDATLASGHVVTVEPGVYLPEHGGVRIEDTVVVTSDGCRPLTATPKDMLA
jgi:Xaa-Pro aminopeptidase